MPQALRDHDSKLMLVGVDPVVRDQLAKTGVLKVIGEENVFLATPQLGVALNQAVAAANAWLGQPAMARVRAGLECRSDSDRAATSCGDQTDGHVRRGICDE